VSETKHTPGPWVVDAVYKDSVSSVAPGIDDNIICLSPSVEGWTDDRWPANAHLIAAAPDMLEALRIALDAATWDATCTIPDDVRDQMSAAIKKSRGEK
jgi:hypothetical protein